MKKLTTDGHIKSIHPDNVSYDRDLRLVRVERAIEDSDELVGFVLKANSELVLVNTLGDIGNFNGFSVLRKSDVVRLSTVPKRSFDRLIVEADGIQPRPFPGVAFQNLSTLVESASRLFGIVSIMNEFARPDISHVGVFEGSEKRHLRLKEINIFGEIQKRISRHQWMSITRVDFGGPYEEALGRVVNHLKEGSIGNQSSGCGSS